MPMLATLVVPLLLATPSAPATPVPAVPSASPALSTDEVVKRVNAANTALAAWSARFLQRRHFVHFNETETRSGRIAYKRGSGLRIDLSEPDPESILLLKDKVLQWRPKTRQLHVFKIAPGAGKDVSPIPWSFGDGGFDPAKDHRLRLIDSAGPEIVLELTPREEGGAYARKTVWLDPVTWLPLRVRLVEATDDEVNLVFSEAAANPALDPSLFVLKPPAGTEVVEHANLPSF